MATTNAQSQRLKSRQRSQQIRNQRKNQTKPFEGEATRMYKGIEYPLSMLKTNARGRVLGVKETVDSKGPNPKPSIEKIEKQNKSDNTSDNKNTRKQSTVTKATTKSIDSGKKQSIDKIKEDEIEPDFVSALKLCKRRRIGPLRPGTNRELFYKKDMGILARGGFSFELSKRVLDLEKNEFDKLIKII